MCATCISATSVKRKPAPEEEDAVKAENNGTVAKKSEISGKPKAVAKSERKTPLSQAREKVETDAKIKARKAPVPKRANKKGKNKKTGNKQQRRKSNGKARPQPPQPANSGPKNPKDKKKQPVTTTEPNDEGDYTGDVQDAGPEDEQDPGQDYEYETERPKQKPHKKGRRPPPKVIVVVQQQPGPNHKFPFLQPTPRPGEYTPYNPYLKYMTTLPPTSNGYWQHYYPTTAPPGYYYDANSGGYVSKNADMNYYYSTTYYPMWKNTDYQSTEYPYVTSTNYNPYWNTNTNNYQQFWTTYYPNYNWTTFYGNNVEAVTAGYYDYTTQYWRNEASREDFADTQYNRSYALPTYFPSYNWTSIYGQYTTMGPYYWSSDVPYNSGNWSQNYDAVYQQQQMFKNSTATTPEPSTTYMFADRLAGMLG